MSNGTQLSIAPPVLHDEPTAYLNSGGAETGGQPFAVVELGTQAWLYIHEAGHAHAIAAAFTKAAQLLEDDAAHRGTQDGAS